MKEKVINSLRVERARHKITQRELAVGVNVSGQTIHSIESYKFYPSVETALKIIRFLNELKLASGMDPITIEDVFKLEKEKL